MPGYVDGFVLPVPKGKIAAYKKLSKAASKVWMDHGALEYRECAGDDLKIKGMVSFTSIAKAKPSETVVFAWIVYKSKAHRNAVNKKVMADPRIAKMMKDPPPFDCKRMAYGGFSVIVEALRKG
ncbi:MAG: hypothetical protein AMXMBFR47_09210 [Planctomycetota bacterium]